jgi:hypothetical protein
VVVGASDGAAGGWSTVTRGHVIVEGKAEPSRDPVALRAWAGQIGARYMGVGETEHLAELNGGPGNVLVRVIPTHVVTESSITE